MAPDFVKENCVACGKCASECPTGAIDSKPIVVIVKMYC